MELFARFIQARPPDTVASDAVTGNHAPRTARSDTAVPPSNPRELVHRIIARRVLLTLVMLAALATSRSPHASAAAGPYVLHIAPTGSDAASGLSAATPLKTFEGAEAKLQAAAITDRDVEIRVALGTYAGMTTRWATCIPGHTISFLPEAYDYSGSMPVGGRPLFVAGPDVAGADTDLWFLASIPSGDTAERGGLRFYYLEVSGYRTGGLNFSGRYGGVLVPGHEADGLLSRPLGGGLDNNVVYGMSFDGLGTTHKPKGHVDDTVGQYGIVLANSSNNVVRNNHFVNLENAAADSPGNIHGVYLRVGANNNLISNNSFRFISGAAVDARNDSNNNVVENNVFDRVGTSTVGVYLDWSCDLPCAETYAQPAECSSHGNWVRYNEFGRTYADPTVQTKLFHLRAQTATHSACSDDGQPWLETTGNIKT